MTEKEKMLAGYLYYAGGEELFSQHLACMDLCHAFNMLKPSELEKRKELIQKILGRTGAHCYIEQPFWCDYGSNIEIGDYFCANHGLTILDVARVTFGDHVFIAPDCGFYTAGHPLDAQLRSRELEYGLPITVGSDVWIGGHVTVLPGVTIGSNVVIGAGSVVTKDIPDGVVAVGNPCRPVRSVRGEDTRSRFCPEDKAAD